MRFTFRWSVRWGKYGERDFSLDLDAADITAAYDAYRHARRNKFGRLYSILDETGAHHYDRERHCVKFYRRPRMTDRLVTAARTKTPVQTSAVGIKSAASKRTLKRYIDLGDGIIASPHDVEEARAAWLRNEEPYLTFEECIEAAAAHAEGGLYRNGAEHNIVRDCSDGYTVVGRTSPDTAQALKELAIVGPNTYGGFKQRRSIHPFAFEADAQAVKPLWYLHDIGALRLSRTLGIPAPMAGAVLPLDSLLAAAEK